MSLIAGVSTTSWLIALALGSSVVLKTGSVALFLILLPVAYGLSIVLSLLAVMIICPKPAQITQRVA